VRWVEYGIFLAIVVGLAHPVGIYLVRVFERQRTFPDFLLRPVESVIYRLMGVRPEQEMTAGVYFFSFAFFTGLGTLLLLVLLLCQQWLPGGPEDSHLTTAMSPGLAVNTAVSFSTTTTWQAYAGESTLRYLTQLVGLVSQNFLGGAAGLAVGMAFIRGLARERVATLGNFWVDLVRGTLWILLPLSVLGCLALVWQGVPVNFSPYIEAHTVQAGTQTIALGPVAPLEIIKNLGTNGGGFFNANGAHPYSNPTPFTSFLSLLAIAVVPASFPIAFGRMVGQPRAGWVLLGVMLVLFVAGLAVCNKAEEVAPPNIARQGVVGGNMEGKETRFGIGDSVLTAVVTSNGATGSSNAMHDSFQPLSVLVLLANMLNGEVVFGGLGTGLYSIVMIALVGVFIGGLMVGRTPQYLGKTLHAAEMKLIALYLLLTPLVVLLLAALAVATDAGRAGLVTNSGPRGFTEVVFAYASCMANNGQTMAGLDANRAFYNLTTPIAMLAGRIGFAGLALTLAGRLATQGRKAGGLGALPCDTATFGVLVLATVLVIAALSFLPALALGPSVEQFQR